MREKTLANVDSGTTAQNVEDVQFIGDADLFQVLSKAWSESEGWMKSTKALEIKGLGCVVQVTTQQRNPDGSASLAEAVTWVPHVKLDYSASPPTLKPLGSIK